MFGISSIIKIVSILVIVLVVAAGGWYVTGLRADLAVSQENTKKLVESVSSQQAVIEQIKDEQKQIKMINESLAEQVVAQNKDVDALRDRFSQSSSGKSRDIGKLAVEKPKLIENVINKASLKALRCLELASGSELIKGETNEECPALVNVAS